MGGDWLSAGEIGCALSHLSLYEKLISSHENSMIIFEDDIVFHKDLTADTLKKLKDFVDSQSKPTVLALHTCGYMCDSILRVNDVTIHDVTGFWLAHAYIINNKAAKNILRVQRPLRFVIDWWRRYYYLNCCQLFAVDMDLVWQNESISSLLEEDRAALKNASFYVTREKVMKRNFLRAWFMLSISDKMVGFWRYIKKHFNKAN